MCVCMKYISDYIYVYQYNCMLILLSSPYLLVFGNDRVCGTREQRMLMQVVLEMLRHGAGESLGVYILSCFMILAYVVNFYELFLHRKGEATK